MMRLTVSVCLFVIGTGAVDVQASEGAPVIIFQSFHTSTPAHAGGAVGIVRAENVPTGWAIVAGDLAGDFAISENGLISFTANGAIDYDGSTAEKTVMGTVRSM